MVFVFGWDIDVLDERCAKNELIPAPQELNDERAAGTGTSGGTGGGWGDESSDLEPTRLSGRILLAGGCGDVSGLDTIDARPERVLAASDLDTSTRLLDALTLDSGTEEVRCIQRSRTPSTALKKLVEPAVIVRDTASRAGASCWSSFRSWMPSLSRRLMSATTEGRSLHGWLKESQ